MARSGQGAAGRRSLSLKARALQWLAQREHSAHELRRKLLDYALRQAATSVEGRDPRADDGSSAEAEVDALLAWLQAGNHLSESRFVESRLRVRAGRYGNLRIRQELALHGLEVTPEADEQLRASEAERARAVWARRFDALPADAASYARQARFLAGRGFSAEVIRRLLRGAEDQG